MALSLRVWYNRAEVLRVTYQLYLHFPFCKRKCLYCDFCSMAADAATVEAYCAALVGEIRRAGAEHADCDISTVYIGGGTPSIVPARLIGGVLDELKRAFNIRADAEISSEANPGTLNAEWLDAAVSRGVNRLSLGMQASQTELLQALGRIHTHAETAAAVRLARESGIGNVNLDLMYGLPLQTAGMYLDAIDAAAELAPEHISAYSLILEDGTPLCEAARRGDISVPDDDEVADMCEAGAARLETLGYSRYEISNYARDGCECRHNLGYWQGAYYIGLGLNAHGMLPPSEAERAAGAVYTRVYNTDKLERYIEEGGDAQAGRQPISADEAMFETVMLGLRTVRGINEREFASRHGTSLQARYRGAPDALVSDGLAERRDGFLRLTPHGLMVQNAVLLRLMDV